MSLFRTNPTIARDCATGTFVVKREGITAADVWKLLTEMFSGKGHCIVLSLDRLIPVTGGNVKTGSQFEDYNAAGPRRPLTVTTWDPVNMVLSFRIQPPASIEKKHRHNAWEYQFMLFESNLNEVCVDIQLVIEHNARISMDAVRTVTTDIYSICTNVIGHNRATFERESIRKGLSVRTPGR